MKLRKCNSVTSGNTPDQYPKKITEEFNEELEAALMFRST
jgi:hypothetical protein